MESGVFPFIQLLFMVTVAWWLTAQEGANRKQGPIKSLKEEAQQQSGQNLALGKLGWWSKQPYDLIFKEELEFDVCLAPKRNFFWRVAAIFLSAVPLVMVLTVLWDWPVFNIVFLIMAIASIVNTAVASFYFSRIYFSFQKFLIILGAVGISFTGVTSLLHPLMIAFGLPFIPAFLGLLGSLTIMYPLVWKDRNFLNTMLFTLIIVVAATILLAAVMINVE